MSKMSWIPIVAIVLMAALEAWFINRRRKRKADPNRYSSSVKRRIDE